MGDGGSKNAKKVKEYKGHSETKSKKALRWERKISELKSIKEMEQTV